MGIQVGSIGGLQCFQRQCIRFPQQCSEVDKSWPFSSHFLSLCVNEYIMPIIECSEADDINICPRSDFLVSLYLFKYEESGSLNHKYCYLGQNVQPVSFGLDIVLKM